jgi:hypothetical protein
MEAASSSQSNANSSTARSARSIASVVLALAAGGMLRIWMFSRFFETNGDALVYGGIAKNLLLRGRYALSLTTGETFSTLIRLPGYPCFLALTFKLFGMENYAAAVWVQIVLDLCACLLLADAARRIAPPALSHSAAHATLWLAALCPFTAIYAAAPLTEALTLFSIALALWAATRFQDSTHFGSALAFTFAVTFAALLRPDGVLAAIALTPAMLIPLRKAPCRESVRIVVVCSLLALAPFAVWTVRNWRVFHVFQPLAPKSATDPGDPVYPGWERWVKTWCLDFVSTYNIYWNVPDDVLDISKLPSRAFDTLAQYHQTRGLAAEYNGSGMNLSLSIDEGFEALAQQRIAANRARYYLWLPLGRVADMWLRPRIENLPIDLDWWVYSHHRAETRFSWGYAALNALYLLLGIAGLCFRPRLWGWMLAYMLVRSAMLFTICPPEARYTLECFPLLFVLGGVALGRIIQRGPHSRHATG